METAEFPENDRRVSGTHTRRRGGECLASEYVNATTKLWWRCRDGHEWDALPGSIVQGTWCPVCGHAGSSTAPLSIEVMQEIAVKRGGLCLSTRYTNLRSRLRWRCALGHDWVASAANVRHGGSWCPTCAHSVPGDHRRDAQTRRRARWQVPVGGVRRPADDAAVGVLGGSPLRGARRRREEWCLVSVVSATTTRPLSSGIAPDYAERVATSGIHKGSK